MASFAQRWMPEQVRHDGQVQSGLLDQMTKAPAAPGLRLGIDYGPLLVFFLVNFVLPGAPIVRVLAGTVAFMLATIVAMIVSRLRLGGISPMLWLSGVLVVVFGGLTLYFHDQRFIQMKPTIVYLILAATLGFGLATGRPLLQQVLGTAYPGLTDLGWRKLTRNWAAFFVVQALLNEVVRRRFSLDFWVAYKLWGAVPLTVLFALANVPMLLKNGLTSGEGEAVAKELPPE